MVVNNRGEFTYYGNNTPDGTWTAYAWEFLQKVNYGSGRVRDLVLFAVVDDSFKQLRMDRANNPMMCVCVCNSTKGISGKAKINKIRRALITAENNISNLESYKTLPDMNSFCFSKDFKGSVYKIKVENKIVNKKRVSNVTHIFSYLAKDFMDIRGTFDVSESSEA